MTTPDVSHIDEIVDQAAATAAGVAGVVAIWGVGSGLVVDPILTAQEGSTVYVRPGLPTNVVTGTLVASVTRCRLTHRSATASILEWEIALRHYIAANDAPTAHRLAVPLFVRYTTAFGANTMLGASVNSALLEQFQFFEDVGWEKQGISWYGIEMTLTAIERLDLELQAGAGTWPP